MTNSAQVRVAIGTVALLILVSIGLYAAYNAQRRAVVDAGSATNILAASTPVMPSATPYTGESLTIPSPSPASVTARYQPFQQGFMVQRMGENCVFVFSTRIVIPREIASQPFGEYSYCTRIEGLPENLLVNSAPPGLFVPTGVFGQIWDYYEEVREALGYATEAEITYKGRVPAPPAAISGAPFSTPIITLPDGQTLSCGFRAASVGCSLQ